MDFNYFVDCYLKNTKALAKPDLKKIKKISTNYAMFTQFNRRKLLTIAILSDKLNKHHFIYNKAALIKKFLWKNFELHS